MDVLQHGWWTKSNTCLLNEEFSTKSPESYQVHQASKEGWRMCQQKDHDNNNQDEDTSLHKSVYNNDNLSS